MALSEGPLPSPHPLCSSPYAVGFVVLDTLGIHGAKTFNEHFITHFPIFSYIELLLPLAYFKNKQEEVDYLLGN